jgi:hypothetical protein
VIVRHARAGRKKDARPGSSGLDDDVHRLVDVVIVHCHIDFHPQSSHVIPMATPRHRVRSAGMVGYLGHRQPGDGDVAERPLDLFDPVGMDDAADEFHRRRSLLRGMLQGKAILFSKS